MLWHGRIYRKAWSSTLWTQGWSFHGFTGTTLAAGNSWEVFENTTSTNNHSNIISSFLEKAFLYTTVTSLLTKCTSDFVYSVQINSWGFTANTCMSFRPAHTKPKPEQYQGFVKPFEMKNICKCKWILLWCCGLWEVSFLIGMYFWLLRKWNVAFWRYPYKNLGLGSIRLFLLLAGNEVLLTWGVVRGKSIHQPA